MKRRAFLLSTSAFSLQPVFCSEAIHRIAVIGHTGRGNYGHGIDTCWLTLPGAQIVVVADADEKGLQAALKKLNITRGFSDYRQMLAELKPEFVGIGPRHVDQHRDMALACIEAGVKGIYMEKPFCRTLAEADEIVAACEKHGAKLALAHRNRYHPVMPIVKQLLDDGKIGRVLEIRCRGKEDKRGGSLDLWVLGSHLLNLSHYFAGDPVSCYATVLQNGKPATKADLKEGDEGVGPLAGNEVHTRFEMSSGIPVFFDSVQDAGLKTAGFGIQIIGNEGIIDLRTDEEPAAHLLVGSPFRPVTEPRAWTPVTSGGVGVPEPMKDIREMTAGHGLPVRDLIAATKENREPLCGVKDGRVILEMIMGVFESHRKGGARVTLPLKDRGHPFSMLR
jgi:predicted dehydrogenase